MRLAKERISGNAFRVLGLPGDASQQAIEASARKMRIWPTPERIPPTAWDLPWVGSLSRSRMELEQAVARLTDPKSRIEERLLWFGAGERRLSGESHEQIERSIAELSAAADAPSRHAGALA